MRAEVESPPTRAVIRVFVVDDHELVCRRSSREGLYELLLAAEDLRIVGESATAADALRRIPIERPDVVLLDVSLPDGSSVELCRTVRERCPSIRVLMLIPSVDHRMVLESMLAGASGFALSQIRNQALVDAVRSVAAGRSRLCRADNLAASHRPELPPRPDGR